ncbi:hypothetical protein ElyMa_005807700 [Elysia marginata]|uniref:G-protein coupled receptors family 1 profile domain-containing protein n=1 Tax=Elysia marginata TaxID=1093978 RepID=A0AAV4FUL9_9GAST|nr:hypothetical protein ElyMa_005807700 [Elysia marginata]
MVVVAVVVFEMVVVAMVVVMVIVVKVVVMVIVVKVVVVTVVVKVFVVVVVLSCGGGGDGGDNSVVSIVYGDVKEHCLFPIRFLYVHNSSYIHAMLLTSLFISFLAIVKEYLKHRKRRQPFNDQGCCSCRKGRKDSRPVALHDDPAMWGRTSATLLQPRSPVLSRCSLNAASPYWFRLNEQEGSPKATRKLRETDVDTRLSFDYQRDSLRYSNRQHNHIAVSDAAGSLSPGEKRVSFIEPVLSFLPKPNLEKEALLSQEESELEAKESLSRKEKARKNFDRRNRGTSGYVFLKEDTEDDWQAEGVDDKRKRRKDVVETILRHNLHKAEDVGLELTEDGLQVYTADDFYLFDETSVSHEDIICRLTDPNHTKGLYDDNTQSNRIAWDRNGKLELHKSIRVFNSIDKYCLDATAECTALEELGETNLEEKAARPMVASFGLDAKENIGAPRDVPGNKGTILPATSLSDNDMTATPRAPLNKARTDSLYTLRSGLSIPEDNASRSIDHRVRDICSSSIVGNGLTVGTIAPYSGVKGKSNESSAAVELGGVKHRRSGAEGTDSVLFTIGDGNEDVVEDDIERRWQCWDDVFGANTNRQHRTEQLLIQDQAKRTRESVSFNNLFKEKPQQQLSTGPCLKPIYSSETVMSDSSTSLSTELSLGSLENIKGRTSCVNNNVNKNEQGQNVQALTQPTTSQSKVSEKTEKAGAFALRWGVKKKVGNPAATCDGGRFSNLGKKTAAKYKLMLKNWTFQSLNRETDQSLAFSSLAGSKRSVGYWLDFYHMHCGFHQDSALYGQHVVALDAKEQPMNSNNRLVDKDSNNYARRGCALLGKDSPIPPRFEVEEEADTEDGLLPAQRKSEIDAAVGQWLEFYDINRPSLYHDQSSVLESSECSSIQGAEFSENGTNEWKLPELNAVGDVTHGDLLKARRIWFQFYNINPQSQSHSSPCERATRVLELTSNTCLAVQKNPSTSPVEAAMPRILSDALRKISSDEGIKNRFPVGSSHAHATEIFTSQLFKKLTPLSNESYREIDEFSNKEKETSNLEKGTCDQEKLFDVTSRSDVEKVADIPRNASGTISRFLSLDELSCSQGTISVEIAAKPYPSTAISDPIINLSSTSVDPASLKSKIIGKTDGQHDRQSKLDEDLQHCVTRRSQPLLPRVAARETDRGASSNESSSHLTGSSPTSGQDQNGVQVCPPCSPTSDTARSGSEPTSRNETLQSESTPSDAGKKGSEKSLDLPCPLSGTDLASRLIESVSLKRRALLAELGLYQDLLTGLIPLDWVLPRAASEVTTTHDVEAARPRTRQGSGGSSESFDLDLESECPYCLRRTRERHAHAGQQVEAKFRHLFGIPVPAFAQEEASNSVEERGKGSENRDEVDSTVQGGKAQIRGLQKDSHGGHRGAASNSNNNSTKFGQNLHIDPEESINQPDRSMSLRQILDKKKQDMKRGWRFWIKRSSFQALLLKDPMLALVISYGLIIFTQFACWWPKTALYIYYDQAGFPEAQTAIEMICTILWYARVVLTPCVYLFYSKGYRENFEKILKQSISKVKLAN